MTNKLIVSKIKPWMPFYILFLLVGIVFSIFLLYVSVRKEFILGILVAFYLLFALLLVLREFKYIIIDKVSQTLRWYSFFSPFGKCVMIRDYAGLIKSKEYTSSGTKATAYLVDSNMYTRVKISSVGYRNFEEMINTIELPEIKNYKFNIAKYLQLLFLGKMKVEKKLSKKKR